MNRANIVAIARRSVATVRERRTRDLGRIADAYQKLGRGDLTFAAVQEAYQEMKAHLSSVIEQAKAFEGRPYRTWSGQIVPENESFYAQWMSRQLLGYALRYETEVLGRIATMGESEEILRGLLDVGRTDAFLENSLADGPDGIAGYEAKMLLFYALPEKERRGLAGELELRFDLRDVAPAELAKQMDGHAYSHSVFTDGYYFGALRPNAKGLIGTSRNAFGVGIDCSTFVQEIYELSGYPESSFASPISTGSMIQGEMPGLQDGTFEVLRLQSEAALVPGDAILWPGHVQIFLGRDEQGRLRIAEAVGRRFKTVRESTLPLCGADGVSVFDNPACPMYVFRPRAPR